MKTLELAVFTLATLCVAAMSVSAILTPSPARVPVSVMLLGMLCGCIMTLRHLVKEWKEED